MSLTRPMPRADALTQGFWDATAEGRLAIQRCAACRTFQHPPRKICQECGHLEVAFENVSGRGRLWSWTTTHHNIVAGFEEALPYQCLLIELDEQKGLFVLSDLADRSIEAELKLGMKMRVVFSEPLANGAVLPQFEPDGEGA